MTSVVCGWPARNRSRSWRPRGTRTPTSVNTDPMRQPDAALRALNEEPSTPGPRDEVYCTKVGSSHPEQMYIVGAHMDGHGWGEAANDNGSGTVALIEKEPWLGGASAP